jgi:hypothetical protein
MPPTITLLDPTARREQGPAQTRQQMSGLANTVVGFIDNAKPNFNHLVDDLAELLTSRYGVKEVIKRRKRSASVPAPDAIVEDLGASCDLVIAGSGD